eukprot:TRINITY_DN7354_c0_g1_i2.p1 TRINITY_DN7354_c0_g1~~TRINITY_DN7354_c0_g1_i2.p1  ORF type:complete len:142 (+),score=26.40 TRINITY_DN7354_c0_g1_i2:271-696(+)
MSKRNAVHEPDEKTTKRQKVEKIQEQKKDDSSNESSDEQDRIPRKKRQTDKPSYITRRQSSSSSDSSSEEIPLKFKRPPKIRNRAEQPPRAVGSLKLKGMVSKHKGKGMTFTKEVKTLPPAHTYEELLDRRCKEKADKFCQ